jgi:periplasmic divalent cation tolerance protein
VKRGGKTRIVLVTCANVREARRIARRVVERRLAACVNIAPGPVESFYRWKNLVETARERLLIIKTTATRLARLEAEIRRSHSYEVPEFLVLKVSAGSRPYLAWVAANV